MTQMPEWITEGDLLWRPHVADLTVSWNGLRWLGNGKREVRPKKVSQLVEPSTRKLIPFIRKELGQRGVDQITEVEAAHEFLGVDSWVRELKMASAFAHLGPLPDLASVKRQKMSDVISFLKRRLELDRKDKMQIDDLWLESVLWEFRQWRDHLRATTEKRDIPYGSRFLTGIIKGYRSLNYGGPYLGGKSRVAWFADAWLEARLKTMERGLHRAFVEDIGGLYDFK